MMNSKKNIQNLEKHIKNFTSLGEEKDIFEDFDSLIIYIKDIEVHAFLSSINEYMPLFNPFFETVDTNDRLKISILDETDDSILSFSTLSELTSYNYNHEYEDITGKIKILIDKSIEESDYTSIYSMNFLVSSLNEKNNIEYIFDLFFNTTEKFKIIDGENHYFYTDNFIFVDSEDFENRTSNILKKLDSKKECKINKHSKINENSHFANISKIKYLAEDFYFRSKPNNDSLLILFNKLSLSLVLSVFADISEFKENILSYKMYGYKTLKNEYEFSKLDISEIDEYFYSYEEVFNSNSSISDKIGLARNVISLHIVDNDFTKIKGSILSSIKSNYNIYLKENVKKYIDMKNKITDTLFGLSSKFDDIVHDLSNSFRASFYTLATLFISIILLKIIKGSSTVDINVFSVDIYLFLSSVLIAMFLFKKFNISEIEEKKKRLFGQYNQLKIQYSELLDKNDLAQIFELNNFEENNNAFINNQIDKYNEYWNVTLVSYFAIFTFATFCF